MDSPMPITHFALKQQSPIAHLTLLRNPQTATSADNVVFSPALDNSSEIWGAFLHGEHRRATFALKWSPILSQHPVTKTTSNPTEFRKLTVPRYIRAEEIGNEIRDTVPDFVTGRHGKAWQKEMEMLNEEILSLGRNPFKNDITNELEMEMKKEGRSLEDYGQLKDAVKDAEAREKVVNGSKYFPAGYNWDSDDDDSDDEDLYEDHLYNVPDPPMVAAAKLAAANLATAPNSPPVSDDSSANILKPDNFDLSTESEELERDNDAMIVDNPVHTSESEQLGDNNNAMDIDTPEADNDVEMLDEPNEPDALEAWQWSTAIYSNDPVSTRMIYGLEQQRQYFKAHSRRNPKLNRRFSQYNQPCRLQNRCTWIVHPMAATTESLDLPTTDIPTIRLITPEGQICELEEAVGHDFTGEGWAAYFEERTWMAEEENKRREAEETMVERFKRMESQEYWLGEQRRWLVKTRNEDRELQEAVWKAQQDHARALVEQEKDTATPRKEVMFGEVTKTVQAIEEDPSFAQIVDTSCLFESGDDNPTEADIQTQEQDSSFAQTINTDDIFDYDQEDDTTNPTQRTSADDFMDIDPGDTPQPNNPSFQQAENVVKTFTAHWDPTNMTIDDKAQLITKLHKLVVTQQAQIDAHDEILFDEEAVTFDEDDDSPSKSSNTSGCSSPPIDDTEIVPATGISPSRPTIQETKANLHDFQRVLASKVQLITTKYRTLAYWQQQHDFMWPWIAYHENNRKWTALSFADNVIHLLIRAKNDGLISRIDEEGVIKYVSSSKLKRGEQTGSQEIRPHEIRFVGPIRGYIKEKAKEIEIVAEYTTGLLYYKAMNAQLPLEMSSVIRYMKKHCEDMANLHWRRRSGEYRSQRRIAESIDKEPDAMAETVGEIIKYAHSIRDLKDGLEKEDSWEGVSERFGELIERRRKWEEYLKTRDGREEYGRIW